MADKEAQWEVVAQPRPGPTPDYALGSHVDLEGLQGRDTEADQEKENLYCSKDNEKSLALWHWKCDFVLICKSKVKTGFYFY